MNFIRSETAHAIEKNLLAIISPHSLSPSLLPLCPPSLPLSLHPLSLTVLLSPPSLPILSPSFPPPPFLSGFGEGDRATRDEREEREAYRTRGGLDYSEKKADTGAGAEFKPEFRGGFGRGRGFGAPGGGRFGQ